MQNYDHKKIEKKWQKEWEEKGTYKTLNSTEKKKMYILDMFPYPSGVGLHVGHPRGYIGSDVYARMKRTQGYNVLHPMGYDAFGLPAEQYALQHKIHPQKAVEDNVKTFRKQLSIIGLSYDWSRVVNTTDPKYYKWTQWIFLQIYNSWYDKTKNKARDIKDLELIFSKNGNKKVNASCSDEVEIFTAQKWNSFSKKDKQDILMKYRLAYEGYSEVNWCPLMGTVLANDEIINDEKGNPISERGGFPVEKKLMRQWFMRITAYADRLLSGLDGLEWSDHIKEIQKNWIGKSEGSEIEFSIKNHNEKIKVFTTRADTIFGATYVVLAPEHSLIENLKVDIQNLFEVENYIQNIKNKTDEDRTKNDKEKTGVELKGIKAINPANNEEVSIWVADYVLASYGTGAVMAVPAHDERDFEFAKKYDLPVKYVVEAATFYNEGDSAIKKDLPFIERYCVCAIVRNPKDDTYLCTNWKDHNMHGLITGGIEEGEDIIEAAKREVYEESGYKNLNFIKDPGFAVHTFFYHRVKKVNRHARFKYLIFDLIDEERDKIDEKESAVHEIVWKTKKELSNYFTVAEGQFALNLINNVDYVQTEDGILYDSGNFNGLSSEEARKKVTEFVGGKLVVKYKMRDAIFARQRYWGEPIPLKHNLDGNILELKEKDLPLLLPNVKSYESTGTGESPLAGVKSWAKEGYETNTMPGWAGSSWYFLRYMDPLNTKQFASEKLMKYWKDVDVYVGGQEHATGHLLYSRFWNNFLYDMGYIPTKEPFTKLINQGMILATDGRKMSKRWGNVINPDDIVKNYGADTLRVYEMFMGPFEQSLPWSTESIIGSRRFIDRVYRIQYKLTDNKSYFELEKILHKTIKKVSEDIEDFAFNTAISSMMILVNEIEKIDFINKDDFKSFIKILSPFAPHVAEEIWQKLGEKESINKSSWPKWDKKKIIDEMIKIVIQVNGKVRTEIMISKDATEEQIKEISLKNNIIINWTKNKEIRKIIYVPGRVVNIVV